MKKDDIIQLLTEGGCPFIAYRVRKEILEDDISEQEYINYQKLIYAEPKVQKILSWQNPDGYFGTRLHTAPTGSKIWTHEGCVRYLIETGLDNENVHKALNVMLCPGWGKECENSRAASTFKYELIRASLFAQAGIQNDAVLPKWVDDAVQGFQNIAETENYKDLVEERRDGKLVYKKGFHTPVIYHLRILAFTDSWRTEENMKMMKTAYEKLYQWLPFPPTYHMSKYPVAPLGLVSAPLNQNFSNEQGFVWLHFYELSARMGMLGKESPFRKHFEDLKKHVLKQDVKFNEYTRDKNGSYIGWSGYSGSALEGDGETQQERMRDFMFRVLLIDKYSNEG